jgi:hypothetical protein
MISIYTKGQTDDEVLDQLMETYSEYAGSSVDYLDLYDQILKYRKNKININKASYDELSAFALIGKSKAYQIRKHIKLYGKLISIYELQSIPTFTMDYIDMVLPYITINENLGINLKTAFKEGKHELMILHQYSDISHLQPSNPTDSNRILGDGSRALLRYRYAMPGVFSFGLTAEKDAGELWPTSQQGLQAGYLSMHAFIKPKGRIIESLALGDYQVNFGQGLTFSSGLAFGKTAMVLNTFRAREGIRPYRSVNETQFLRGLAVALNLGPKTKLSLFGSINGENVVINENGEAGSINNFGFVRTLRDLSRKNNQTIQVLGGNLKKKIGTFEVGFTAAHQQFSVPFASNDQLYAIHRLAGSELTNVGFDYKGSWKNLLFYGEVAGNNLSKQPAMVHGALIALNKRWSANISYRNFPKDYHTIFNTAWAEQTNPVNEKAMYVGLQYEEYRKLKISAFADVIQFPWLRFRDDAPGFQTDIFLEAKHYFSKYFNQYLRVRRTIFTDNAKSEGLNNKIQQVNERWNARYHIDKDEPGKLATAFRAEVVQLDNNDKNTFGSLFFADLGYHFKKSKIKLVGRYTLFNTPDFESRIYAYENDVLYAFSIPAMYGNGSRFYMVMTAKPFRRFTLWAKLTLEQNERKVTLDQVNFSPLGRVQIRYTW